MVTSDFCKRNAFKLSPFVLCRKKVILGQKQKLYYATLPNTMTCLVSHLSVALAFLNKKLTLVNNLVWFGKKKSELKVKSALSQKVKKKSFLTDFGEKLRRKSIEPVVTHFWSIDRPSFSRALLFSRATATSEAPLLPLELPCFHISKATYHRHHIPLERPC